MLVYIFGITVNVQAESTIVDITDVSITLFDVRHPRAD